MLHYGTIRQAVLEKALSICAAVNRQGTGSCYQLLILRSMGVSVKGPVAVNTGTSFVSPENLTLGRYVTFGVNTRIVSWAPVTIGDDFMASDILNINSGGHDPVTLIPQLGPITIGSRVWCGTGVTICAGVEIGDDVVIGAGSVVVKSLPANSIAAGVPARIIRPLERTNRKLWSMWPERSADQQTNEHSPTKRFLRKLRARI
jgi:acetyltransferase-like isoleucine patch superfamily enzyme